jgi:hypothetical protein
LFNPTSGHAVKVGDDVMLDSSTFDPLSSRINTGRYIWRNGRMRRTHFSIRVFGFTEIWDWLLNAGFKEVTGFDRDGGPLTIESRRMAVIATA